MANNNNSERSPNNRRDTDPQPQSVRIKRKNNRANRPRKPAAQQQPKQQQPESSAAASAAGSATTATTTPTKTTNSSAPAKDSSPQQQQHQVQTPNFRKNNGQHPNHTLTKRPTAKISQRPNDIYVTNKSDFRAQLKQCNTLLSTSDFHEVFLHAIGAALTRAINLALTLCDDAQGGLGYEANTSTITLTDNLHPLHDDGDFSVQQRLNSCLHIRVYRHCRDVLLLDSDNVKPGLGSAEASL